MHEHSRIVRGSQIIGLQVWDSQRQQLGVVRDFVVDYEGSCPSIFFAVSAQGVEPAAGFVVVPWEAIQFQYDARLGRNFIVLGLSLEQFRTAPRLEGNNWARISDLQFLTQTRQFYERNIRTAARPAAPPAGRDATHDPAARPEGGQRPEADMKPERGNRPDVPAAPGTHTGDGMKPENPAEPGTHRESGNKPEAPAAPETHSGGGMKSETPAAPGAHSDMGKKAKTPPAPAAGRESEGKSETPGWGEREPVPAPSAPPAEQ
jgi:hypothetical protein